MFYRHDLSADDILACCDSNCFLINAFSRPLAFCDPIYMRVRYQLCEEISVDENKFSLQLSR